MTAGKGLRIFQTFRKAKMDLNSSLNRVIDREFTQKIRGEEMGPLEEWGKKKR